MEHYFNGLDFPRLLIERGVALIYVVGFLSAIRQFKPLLGESGLLPVKDFIGQTTFKTSPGIFQFHYSDRFFMIISRAGFLLSLGIACGLLNYFPWWLYIFSWLIVWFLYLSIVNVGQTFYSFGWESMLLEAGFFTAFLGPSYLDAPLIPILILRWMLFRVELGAGLIKLRHDPCWRDFTCLYYHYETQPMPGPLSWYFHHFPKAIHRFGVLFSHFVQVVVPFGLFAPQPFAQITGLLIIGHQLWLVLCGNYSWLNWLTIVLGCSAFSNTLFPGIHMHATEARPLAFDIVLYALAAFTIFLSYRPLLNFFAKDQLMNYSYNAYHLVGVYGAFGSVTKERYEIVIEGTRDDELSAGTEWKEYQFKGKPGKLSKTPGQYAPYHLRLDWSMWFLPFNVVVAGNSLQYVTTKGWYIKLIRKLLQADKATIELIDSSPFGTEKPTYIRSLFYRYEFTTVREKMATGNTWKRRLIGEYLQPLSLDDTYQVLRRQGYY